MNDSQRGEAAQGTPAWYAPEWLSCVGTLILLMFDPIGHWQIEMTFLAAGVLGLLWPRARRSPLFWGFLAAVAATHVIYVWPQADNHSYLTAYWLLAVALYHGLRAGTWPLALNARLLIGIVFALATLHKGVLVPDYNDGRFFRYTMSADVRFHDFVHVTTGMRQTDIDANKDFLSPRRESRASNDEFIETTDYRRMAHALTWATLVIEGLIAIAFLVPKGPLHRARDALLMLFCVGTYAVATVTSFGLLLICMGLAQSPPEGRYTRVGYATAFAIILVYKDFPPFRVLAEFGWTL